MVILPNSPSSSMLWAISSNSFRYTGSFLQQQRITANLAIKSKDKVSKLTLFMSIMNTTSKITYTFSSNNKKMTLLTTNNNKKESRPRYQTKQSQRVLPPRLCLSWRQILHLQWRRKVMPEIETLSTCLFSWKQPYIFEN